MSGVLEKLEIQELEQKARKVREDIIEEVDNQSKKMLYLNIYDKKNPGNLG